MSTNFNFKKSSTNKYLFRFIICFCISIYTDIVVALHLESKNFALPEITCKIGECEPATIDSIKNNCVGHISLNSTATDKETLEEELLIEYWIDIKNDGLGFFKGYDVYVSQLSLVDFKKGMTSIIQENIYADNKAQPFNASGNYPYGTHKLVWRVTDLDGHSAQCEILFEVKDCIIPDIKCKSGLLVFNLPISRTVTITPHQLIEGYSDNCSSNDEIQLFINGDTVIKNFSFSCEDFIRHRSARYARETLQVSAMDRFRNFNSCSLIIIIEDNINICPSDPGPIGQIKCTLKNQQNDLITGSINIFENRNLIETIENGRTFNSNFGFPRTLLFSPTKNDDHLNGVSTQDIIFIKKHVLGKSVFNNPVSYLAADVNNSNSITTADISEMQKLILGVQDEFKRVKSWDFIPSDFKFIDVQNPWDAPNEKSITLTFDVPSQQAEFIGFKMGDINNNARPSLTSEKLISRSKNILQIYAEDKFVKAGDYFSIPIRASNSVDIEAMQFTIQFNPDYFQFDYYQSGLIKLNESDIALSKKKDGFVSVAWVSDNALKVNSNNKIFEFRFKALKSGLISDYFGLNSSITSLEASNEFELFDLQFNFYNDTKHKENNLEISNLSLKNNLLFFDCNIIAHIQISIFGLDGRLLSRLHTSSQVGSNQLVLEHYLNQGLYFIKIDSGERSHDTKVRY